METPKLTVMAPPAGKPVKAVVIVLHGGKVRSDGPVRPYSLSYRRMVPIARRLGRVGHRAGVAVWLVRFRLRGWNAPELPAVADARWVIAETRRRHPDVPIVLVGHSMGGRAALRVGGEAGVTAICALAPWIESAEPADHLAGREVLIVHGTADRWTSPTESLRFAAQLRALPASVARFELSGAGHFMLRRKRDWENITRRFVLGAAGVQPPDPGIGRAMLAPAAQGLQVELEVGA